MPGLYVTVDSGVGHGQAVWTYRDDGKSGLAYWCEFMGLAPFWAEDGIACRRTASRETGP
ncbi:hypothetical protein [Enterobacter cloacae complex sp. 288G10]|uniref:hypothetical protein n=1 Tax=Enterobacter cloacae complex sp. 288G10 TaxID=3395859 RepID=UPI003CFBB01E